MTRFNANDFVVLTTGLAAALQHAQDDEQTQLDLSSRNRSMPEWLIDSSEYFGTGMPTLAIIASQIFIDPTAARAHAESALLSGLFVNGAQNMIGRTRPNGRENSMPSGHATLAFVTATNLYFSHGWQWGLPAYMYAAFVGYQRVRDNRHWVSDVILGASVGTFFGLGATQDSGKQNKILPLVMHDGGGVMWAYTF